MNNELPPHDREAEQYIIGASIFDEQAFPEIGAVLTPKHFYDHRHQRIYTAIQKLGNANKPIDLMTVTQEVRDLGGEPGDALYIADCYNSIVGLHSLTHQIERVVNKFALRNIARAASEITELCYEDGVDAATAVGESEKIMFDALQSRNQVLHVKEKIADVAEEYLDEVALLRSGETQSGLATGFEKLDELIVLRPGNMVVVAGRPAMGKTAFALAMGDAQLPEAKSVAIFSLEMSTTEMVCRLLSLQSGIVGNDIRTGRLTDAQFEHLQFIKDELKDKKLFIDDTAYKTVAQIKNRARYLQHKYGLDLIIIDYIQLLGEAADENRVQEVSHITRSIKMLAKELRIPVIALSQLSRAVEMRNNKRPVLSDLRESGSIEQDADIVMFVYRDEYYNPETLYRCCAEIIVAKNRHGNCGTAMLGFKGSTTEFFNLKEAVNV